ncbi:hypothetical protein BpHYR1_039417 [Brachionus plicatilis]|uniref:FLYWCH-type domain-containing protein n=1 Tax=Brachionus plicatilis TaxID=10195 RepID=A0A3M7R0U1_BRAPC|nr:hypothetical protein BpHYR1_039417 [Brachionus plicatilis]
MTYQTDSILTKPKSASTNFSLKLKKDYVSAFINSSRICMSDVEGFIAQSQKKGAQLCHEGYYYRVQSESKGVIKWRCIKTGKNEPNCTAKCRTSTREIGAKCVVEIVDEKLKHKKIN